MLTLDLARLDLEGSLEIEAAIPVDSPLWEGSGLEMARPLVVSLRASEAGSGEIIASGRISGALAGECRRCLKAVETVIDQDVVLVFTDSTGDEDGGDLRVIPEGELELDVGEAIREELLLESERFVECDPECKGLCPTCGINRNDQTCECTVDEPDPRWDALRALKSE